MKNEPDNLKQQSPSAIAREAFRQMAIRRIPPKPDAYRLIYNELAGISEPYGSENVLTAFPDTLKKATGGIADLRDKMQRAAKEKDWQSYMSILSQLVEKHLLKTPDDTVKSNQIERLQKVNTAAVSDDSQLIMLRDMLARTLNLGMATLLQGSPELMKEAEALSTVIKDSKPDTALSDAAAKLKQLCFKISLQSDSKTTETLVKRPANLSVQDTANSTASRTAHESIENNADTAILREMLVRTFNLGVVPLLDNAPELMKEAETLVEALKNVKSETALSELSAQVKQVCFKIAQLTGNQVKPYETLVKRPLLEKSPILAVTDDPRVPILREMLARTFGLGVASLLEGTPDLIKEAEDLATTVKNAISEEALSETEQKLKRFLFKISTRSDDLGERQDLLLRLFTLLMENVGGLIEDDSWLKGQIDGIRNMLSGPIDSESLKDATRTMKDIIYKQGVVKHGVTEAKATVKKMMLEYIDRLSELTATTGDYHEKITGYSHQIGNAHNVETLNTILENVLRETRITQEEIVRSHGQMLLEKKHILEAEQRIEMLQLQLAQMSELVMEDELTGSLNRRGLEDVLEREIARSNRKKTPLCLAILDLDDFKRLNDTRGHLAGDEALIHLVKVIKQTLRAMDVVARFGGEEFLVVLPDTPLNAATDVVTRLQRELTKQIFMYNNERILITFSAGVALRKENEEQSALILRVDQALYKAKISGKNRVVAAE